MGDIMEEYMKLALKEATKAYKKGEIPVGAVIVKNGKVIARAHNLRESKKMSTAHAEILVINKACKKLKNWRLKGCELYVTLEPCMMCSGAIIQSRISTVIYGTENNDVSSLSKLEENNVKIIENVCKEKCQSLMQNFFIEKRNQNL